MKRTNPTQTLSPASMLSTNETLVARAAQAATVALDEPVSPLRVASIRRDAAPVKGREGDRRRDAAGRRVWSDADTIPDRFYFAYGSNLSMEQMKRRCPDSVPVAAFTLKGHTLVFRRVADVVPEKGAVVLGAIYRISARDQHILDGYEGCVDGPNGRQMGTYRREFFWLNPASGRRRLKYVEGDIPVLMYVMNRTHHQAPEEDYFNRILAGYSNWNLPDDTLYAARQVALDETRGGWGVRYGYGASGGGSTDYLDEYRTARRQMPVSSSDSPSERVLARLSDLRKDDPAWTPTRDANAVGGAISDSRWKALNDEADRLLADRVDDFDAWAAQNELDADDDESQVFDDAETCPYCSAPLDDEGCCKVSCHDFVEAFIARDEAELAARGLNEADEYTPAPLAL